MDMSTDSRMANLEGNYSRMADSLARTHKGIKDVNENVMVISNSLLGYMDKKTNKLVPGVLQRVDDVEAVQHTCLTEKKESKKNWLGIIKDIGVLIVGAYLVLKLGLA